MKKFFNTFFVTLGVIFLILLIIAVYFFVTDPYNLKPLLLGGSSSVQNGGSFSESENTEDPSAGGETGGFKLSSAQIEALIALGIDPEAVPESISAEQEACFVSALGEARVGEIKTGAVPSALEFLKAKSCI
jgi:amino acid transporter